RAELCQRGQRRVALARRRVDRQHFPDEEHERIPRRLRQGAGEFLEPRDESGQPRHWQPPATGYVATATCAISSYRIADAMMPLWKFATSSFSFGACAFSSGRPTPKRTDGSPSSSWNVDTTGIDPPSRVKIGARPKPFSMARPAACTKGLSNDVIHGLPP